MPDGTNDEKEDVSPPLDWKTKDDIKEVVLHEMHPSPPCCKIRLLLLFYQVPFKVTTKKAGGSYKKVPIMKASGRQINDSFVIFKNLVPVLCGEVFDAEWQNKIDYELQPSIEIEMMSYSSDVQKFMSKGLGLPGCVACCIAGHMGRKFAKGIKNKNPDAPAESIQVAKQFVAAMGAKQFFAGDQPGQVDIAYYGTLLSFHSLGCSAALKHIQGGGLAEWWARMAAVMPNAMDKCNCKKA